MTERGYVYARIGRAGLGNELFPFMRAHEIASRDGRELIPSRWGKIRVGPYLRREADKREYWRLFRAPSFAQRMRRLIALTVRRSAIATTAGMAGRFADFGYPGPWYRSKLAEAVRPGVLRSELVTGRYVAFHVRLGDFAIPEPGQNHHDRNNVSTPIGWYSEALSRIREMEPAIEVVVCSDGRDDQLEPLLYAPGVRRSGARNAVEEMMVLADAVGIVGSRSTFSSWGAFLGERPLLLAPGGNAYPPHDLVFEGTDTGLASWWDAIREAPPRSSAEVDT